MHRLFPIDEVEIGLTPATGGFARVRFPETAADKFSVAMASHLMDLCAESEAQTAAFIFQEQAADLFVAFRSNGDPADIFNVRGGTAVNALPFGRGLAYGPLVISFSEVVSPKLDDLPRERRLWLAGHGIGAAYALLSAVSLEERQPLAAVYTFGAPRVGDSEFASSFACPAFRVVNNMDVMATMPTAWKWRHVGEHKLINDDGSLNQQPYPWNRLPSLVRQTVWLGEMLGQGLSSGFPRALYSLLSQVLKDHSVEAYRSRLKALL